MKRLETRRLVLREWKVEDVHDLFEIMKSTSVTIGGWKPHSNINITKEIIENYINDNDSWAIELKDCSKIIGRIGIPIERNRGKFNARSINYVLSDNYLGKGYMTEAIRTVIKFVFEEMNIDLLSAFHYPENVKSKRVLERCGFDYEMTIEKGCKRFDGIVFDAVCYSIFKFDYFNFEKS